MFYRTILHELVRKKAYRKVQIGHLLAALHERPVFLQRFLRTIRDTEEMSVVVHAALFTPSTWTDMTGVLIEELQARNWAVPSFSPYSGLRRGCLVPNSEIICDEDVDKEELEKLQRTSKWGTRILSRVEAQYMKSKKGYTAPEVQGGKQSRMTLNMPFYLQLLALKVQVESKPVSMESAQGEATALPKSNSITMWDDKYWKQMEEKEMQCLQWNQQIHNRLLRVLGLQTEAKMETTPVQSECPQSPRAVVPPSSPHLQDAQWETW
jgi:hypothetical protein